MAVQLCGPALINSTKAQDSRPVTAKAWPSDMMRTVMVSLTTTAHLQPNWENGQASINAIAPEPLWRFRSKTLRVRRDGSIGDHLARDVFPGPCALQSAGPICFCHGLCGLPGLRIEPGA